MSSIIKISKPGVDVKTASLQESSYSGELDALRVVYKGGNPQTGVTEFVHNLGYTPLHFAFWRYSNNRFVGRYSTRVSNTKIEEAPSYYVLLEQPFEGNIVTGTPTNMFAVANEGEDVKNTVSSQLALNGNYEHLQVLWSGRLTINLPAEHVTSSITRTVTHPHNLGYVPIVYPAFNGQTTGDGIHLNDSYKEPPIMRVIGVWDEKRTVAGIEFDDTNVYFTATRHAIFNNADFGASSATADVTIFVNRLDEYKNYLTP